MVAVLHLASGMGAAKVSAEGEWSSNFIISNDYDKVLWIFLSLIQHLNPPAKQIVQ